MVRKELVGHIFVREMIHNQFVQAKQEFLLTPRESEHGDILADHTPAQRPLHQSPAAQDIVDAGLQVLHIEGLFDEQVRAETHSFHFGLR